MTDLAGLSADQLAEKVREAFDDEPANSPYAGVSLSELVRRASERDQAVEKLGREQRAADAESEALTLRMQQAEVERDQAMRERDEALQAEDVAERYREQAVERADRLAAAVRNLMLAEPPDHAKVSDSCAWGAAQDSCVWCIGRGALAADQEQR